MRISRRHLERPRVELVPMIDTMAFLVVFFMTASLAMTQQTGLPVSLPRAQASDSQAWGERSLVVTLDTDGQVFVDKQVVPAAELADRLRERVADRPDLTVVINADERVPHGAVVSAMDAARAAGAARMAIATRPGRRPPQEEP